MKQRRIFFNYYALIFLFIAVSIPTQVAMVYGLGLNEYNVLFDKMSVINFVVMLICLYNFIICQSGSENMKWSIPLAMGIVCLNNALVLVVGDHLISYAVILTTILLIALCAYFLLDQEDEDVGEESNWWHISTRFKCRERVSMQRERTLKKFFKIHDISSSGLFIECSSTELLDSFIIGETVSLTIGSRNMINCRAKIVRIEKIKGSYPAGLGLQFTEMKISEKTKLKTSFLAQEEMEAA